MMIPPIIRMGPPPFPENRRYCLIVLIRGRGWFIVKWTQQGYLLDQYRSGPDRAFYPEDVVCWMPEDGS